ncbi:MAG: hypothetical protein JW797_05470 [Bradymonadales bacterium]|nr:hypothetical protein [Bradymonadales bacterium]
MALIGLACSPNLAPDPNEKSGDDGERSKAQLIELGAPVNDNVNFNDGDMTDWKYFQIPSPGRVMVTLGCDYTGAYCGANIRDEVGVLVTRMRTDGEPRVSEEVAVQRGNYYLEIFVPSAATDYTVQVNYEPN